MARTADQERALVKCSQWLKNPDQQTFCLSGYAGTGKTTLARDLVEGVTGDVYFCAYTGKAAHVLTRKGCPADTIHSLIYTSNEKSKARLKDLEASMAELMLELAPDIEAGENPRDHRRVLDIQALIDEEKRNLSRPSFSLNMESAVRTAALVVVDEGSMVDEEIGRDLEYFGTKILVLQDEGQLPPIRGAGYFTNRRPDTRLTEVHRQARDSPIIHLATMAREGKRIPLGQYGDCSVREKGSLSPEEALEADQILCGRNKTRYSINHRVRGLKGINDPLPVHGDRLVCLRNHKELGLLNGSIWNVHSVGQHTSEQVFMEVASEYGGQPIEVNAHEHHFLGRGDELSWWDKKDAEEFDYGYALTVHKSQGSQWDNVTVFDESYCFREDRWKWLYTGITRAAEKLTIVES